MIIRNITKKQRDDKILITAEIQMRDEKNPQTIYFSVDKKDAKSLVIDATPFVSIMLLACMKTQENITVEGSTLSEQFLLNLTPLMRQLSRWDRSFHQISITSKVKKDTLKSGENASFFSGGVDSFYSYLKAKKTKKKITIFLFVHGFDIELENRSFFMNVRQGLQKIASEENIRLITLKTNAKRIVEPYVEWDWAHGGSLAAVAQLMRGSISTVTIAGALRTDQLFPYGTHPKLDHLWGTERLRPIHDGNEYDRLGKVMNVVGKSPLALKHLRVCNQNLKGKYNCSRCFKCLWTMMTLECAGTLKKATTFDSMIDLEAVKRMRYTFKRNYHLAGIRVINELKRQKKRTDLQDAIKESLRRSKHPTVLQQLTAFVAELDKKYNKRRIFLTIFAMNTSGDRNKVFKLLARQGLIK